MSEIRNNINCNDAVKPELDKVATESTTKKTTIKTTTPATTSSTTVSTTLSHMMDYTQGILTMSIFYKQFHTFFTSYFARQPNL